MEQISFQSFGARIGICSSDPSILAGLNDRLPPRSKLLPGGRLDTMYAIGAAASERSGTLRYALTRDGQEVHRSRRLAAVHRAFESDVHFYVALNARRWLFVHAGVVGWQGRAIVMPGRSVSGKSSLVAALVKAGAEYYSDEYAVLDGRGRIHPYAKPISLRHSDDRARRWYRVEELGGRAGTKPLAPSLVIVTTYREGARWRPRRRSSADAVMALFDNTLLARTRPAFALSRIEKAVANTAVWKGGRGEAEEAARSILRYADGCNAAQRDLE